MAAWSRPSSRWTFTSRAAAASSTRTPTRRRGSRTCRKHILEHVALRNSSLQGAYFMLAARSLGLDCGPMSGFDNAKVDAAFFAGTKAKSNFLCNLGYGDASKLHPVARRA